MCDQLATVDLDRLTEPAGSWPSRRCSRSVKLSCRSSTCRASPIDSGADGSATSLPRVLPTIVVVPGSTTGTWVGRQAQSTRYLHQAEPVDDDGLGLTELPVGVAGIGAHQVDDLVPEGDVVAPPLIRVGESLPSSRATSSPTRCSGMTVTRVVSTTPCVRPPWSTSVSRCPTRGSGSLDKYSTARKTSRSSHPSRLLPGADRPGRDRRRIRSSGSRSSLNSDSTSRKAIHVRHSLPGRPQTSLELARRIDATEPIVIYLDDDPASRHAPSTGRA